MLPIVIVRTAPLNTPREFDESMTKRTSSTADHQMTQPVRARIFVVACGANACREDAIKRLAMERGNLKGTNSADG